MKYIVAIDWGSSSATVAVGNRDEAGRLRILGVATRPMSEGVVAGEITNIEELTRATRAAVDELEQRLGIDITEAYASISGQELSCNEQKYFVPVASGVVKTDDIERLHELMNAITAPNNNIHIFDRVAQTYLVGSSEQTRNPVGRFGRRLETVYKFIYGSSDNVERMKLAFNRLGIKLLGILTAPQASAVAVLSQDDRELGAAVIDLGATTTEIAIWHDNILRHISVIPLGSAAINYDMRSAAIPTNWIEKLKTRYGYAAPSLIDEEFVAREVKVPGATQKYDKVVSFEVLAQIIEARLADIIDAVQTELRDSGYMERLGGGVVLTGGGANLKKIDELLRDKLRVDVRVAGAEIMSVSEGTDEDYLKPEYATVMGVLLWGLDKGKVEVSTIEEDKGDNIPDEPINPEPEKPARPVETEKERRKREKEEARRLKEQQDRERKLAREEKKRGRDKDNHADDDFEDGGERKGLFDRLRDTLFERDAKNEGDDLQVE